MRRAIAATAVLAALLALPACGSASQPEAGRSAGGVALKRIGSFSAPGFPRLLFVVEQPGRVEVVRHGHKLAKPFLDLRSQVGYDGGERGLLSIAFPQDYPQSKSFYVYYNDRAGNIRVDEFKRRTATRASLPSQRQVIAIPHPVNANHNGGQLMFGGDGFLYVGLN